MTTANFEETIARLERQNAELIRTVNRLSRKHTKRENQPSEGGVYTIKNTVTGQMYVGSAANIKSRLSTHFSQLKSATHGNPLLQKSYDEYGEFAHECAVLELVADREDRLDREQFYLDQDGEYTLNCFRDSRGRAGTPHSAETRKQMSERKKGESHPKFKGYYSTPWGTFTSPYQASISCPFQKVAHSTIAIYCEKNDTIITRAKYGTSPYLNRSFGEEIIGSDFQSIGFGFVAADYSN